MNFKKTVTALLFAVLMVSVSMAAGAGCRPENFSKRGAWSPDSTYRGCFIIGFGDTVSHGTFDGRTLWWRANFFAEGTSTTPGEFAPMGGTSPWVLINSLSASVGDGTPTFQATTWHGNNTRNTAVRNIQPGQAIVPTWRDAASGAYTINLDDIGPMNFETMIRPALDVLEDFPDIKLSWGLFVREMSNDDWRNAIRMVASGHEIFNHSFHHNSAAEQWQWFNPGARIPQFDPSIPPGLRGLTVEGIWPQGFGTEGSWPPPSTATFSNSLVEITTPTYWTGNAPSADPDHAARRQIRALSGTTRLVLPTGQAVYIRYTNRHPAIGADGNLLPGYETLAMGSEIVNEGVIAATGVTWWSPEEFDLNGEGARVTQVIRNDGGHPVFVAQIFAVDGWDDGVFNPANPGPDALKNIDTAQYHINYNIYRHIITAGEYFRRGMRSEFYGYPFDAYSEGTHAVMMAAENRNIGQHDLFSPFVGARGGSKSGVPMSGDFFHPFRIDFDAFYIMRSDWTPDSRGELFTVPNNPHVLLGLNEMVENIRDANGYMIRELHSVSVLPGNSWFSSDPTVPTELWPLNSVGTYPNVGWWGGITQHHFREHLDFVQSQINNNHITVLTPSEAIRYRLTANAFETEATLTPEGQNWRLTLTRRAGAAGEVNPIRRGEITVVVNLGTSVNSLAVAYDGNPSNTSDLNSPRRQPRLLRDGYRPTSQAEGVSGQVWSISLNPFEGNAGGQSYSVLLIRDGEWFGQGVEYTIPDDNDLRPSSISRPNVQRATRTASFAGIRNGQIALNLTAGNYVAELYNVQGRMISRVNINATNGLNVTNLRTDNLGRGVLILNVRDQAGGTSVLQHKLMVR